MPKPHSRQELLYCRPALIPRTIASQGTERPTNHSQTTTASATTAATATTISDRCGRKRMIHCVIRADDGAECKC